MSGTNGEVRGSGIPEVLEVPVVMPSRGQRWAGWMLQIFGLVVLFFSVLSAPFGLANLIGHLDGGGLDWWVTREALVFVPQMLGVVMGSLMRSFGVMMRGGLRFPGEKGFLLWALCSVGKVLCMVVCAGMILGGEEPISSGDTWGSVVCAVLALLSAAAVVWLHHLRGRFVEYPVTRELSGSSRASDHGDQAGVGGDA